MAQQRIVENLNLGFLVTARIGGIVNSLTQANMDLFGVSEATAAARDAGGALVNGRSLVNPETWYTAIASQGGIPQYYTYSATNVRLQELSLGYTIPPQMAAQRMFDHRIVRRPQLVDDVL